jgi:hypothetical protein
MLNTLGVSRDTLVKAASEYATGFLGLPETPKITRELAVKMGVHNARGLPLFKAGDIRPSFNTDEEGRFSSSSLDPKKRLFGKSGAVHKKSFAPSLDAHLGSKSFALRNADHKRPSFTSRV